MFEFHKDREAYFNMQIDNCVTYVVPFIEKTKKINPGMRVLEVGCGEAGVLKPFLDKGCECVGVEFDAPRLDNAKKYMPGYFESGQLKLVSKDIYKVDVEKDLGGNFDIIILKDVIEHIHDQYKMMCALRDLLKPGGCIYFGFPPWQMPFGGHQQMCHTKICNTMPYYHLLPKFLYAGILKMFKEPVDELLEIKETGISIERFERIVKKSGMIVNYKMHYLINPIYKYKFGLNAREQLPVLRNIPWLRNFFTTCVYYNITK